MPPPVPVAVQHRIATTAPLVAFAPAAMTLGWSYFRWASDRSRVLIFFRLGSGRHAPHAEIAFVAEPNSQPCSRDAERARGTKTFRTGGVRVYWTQGAAEQRAWRCVGGVRLVAATLMASHEFTPDRLARIAASARRLCTVIRAARRPAGGARSAPARCPRR